MAVTSPDTIVALSSGRLPAGVAVIRISGPACRMALDALAGSTPPARQAQLTTLRDEHGGVLDKALVLFFPGPRSYTGEDCAEFQLHGSQAVVAAVLAALTTVDGIRLAEAGEFTRRAFLNGKIDLLQAEGLADLISAETEAQRRLALRNSEGAQSQLYAEWRDRILHARAMIEAELDFADESDIPGSVSDIVWTDMAALTSDIRSHIGSYRQAEIIQNGYEVVIIGPPNAGKSSLINALTRRDVAIVSDEPGTTRDFVQAVLDLDGVKVIITDTAGIREGAGTVESIGIQRARTRAESADLILSLAEGGREWVAGPMDVPTLRVATKLDLDPKARASDAAISVQTGEGIPELIAQIQRLAHASAGSVGDVVPSRTRHVQYLQKCIKLLDQALTIDNALELRADDLRLAGDEVGRISGKIDPDHILGSIFSQFCIGK